MVGEARASPSSITESRKAKVVALAPWALAIIKPVCVPLKSIAVSLTASTAPSRASREKLSRRRNLRGFMNSDRGLLSARKIGKS